MDGSELEEKMNISAIAKNGGSQRTAAESGRTVGSESVMTCRPVTKKRT
jgi:hypothetical protein